MSPPRPTMHNKGMQASEMQTAQHADMGQANGHAWRQHQTSRAIEPSLPLPATITYSSSMRCNDGHPTPPNPASSTIQPEAACTHR